MCVSCWYTLTYTPTQYLFYVPFYFQSAQLVDAMESGIRAIPLGLFQILAVVSCSALVTYFGHYVSFLRPSSCLD